MGVIPMNKTTWFDLFSDQTQDYFNHQIFQEIKDVIDTDQLTCLSWLTDDVALYMDMMFYTQHSGSKVPSLILERYLKITNDDVPTVMNIFATLLIQKFADKWDRLYSAITTNYAPLENYDMEQTETPDITHTKTTQTETVTSITDDVTGTDVYGFNSVNKYPSLTTTIS